jgi:hypothetical protein
MGGKDQRIQKDSSENLPETMGSVKQFFEWWIKEFKKDILRQQEETSEDI